MPKYENKNIFNIWILTYSTLVFDNIQFPAPTVVLVIEVSTKI